MHLAMIAARNNVLLVVRIYMCVYVICKNKYIKFKKNFNFFFLDRWGTEVLIFPPKYLHHILITVTFFLPCVGNFSTILLLSLFAFKWYVEYLYRQVFLENTCSNITATQKSASPNPQQSHPPMQG